jgi:ferrous iron transport protein B
MRDHSTSAIHEPAPHEHIEKHRHVGIDVADNEGSVLSVALVGNPNVGKSLFFNFLSGLYVDVSNYP